MDASTCPAPPCHANERGKLPNTGKQWALCFRCRNLNLSTSSFFVPVDEEYRNPEDVGNPITLDTRPWDWIRNATECSLCRLISFAVQAASEDWQAGETLLQCQLIIRRLKGYHTPAEEDIRVIEFVAQFKWTSVRDFLIPVMSDDCPGVFFGRVIKPGQIDIDQVCRWLQKCETEHAGVCQHSRAAELSNIGAKFLVIDVQAQCLRQLPESCRYVALSYVWGGAKQAETTTRNLRDLLNPGALGQISDAVSKTIKDAMEFVKQLGEKYLWVDALCIVQDDQSSKQPMIDNMHLIYASAYVTLFAASGNNSNAGLPGVLPSSRNENQLMAPVAHGLTLIYPVPFTAIKKSAWATRGWTYQEYFLSPRRLIFTAGQVIYQCSTIRWQEDLAQENVPRHSASYQTNHAGKGLDWEPPGLRFSDRTKARWHRSDYTNYLTTYLDRNLSQDNDILNAFAGIMNDAANGGLTSFYGLKKEYFGLDMLWKHTAWATRRPGFPSWSWAGWKGSNIKPASVGTSSEEIWLHRKSWIHWYAYDKARENFFLLASGHRAEMEEKIAREERKKGWQAAKRKIRLATSDKKIGGIRQTPTASAPSGAMTLNIRRDKTLAPLLGRLSRTSTDEVPMTRPTSFPVHCIPASAPSGTMSLNIRRDKTLAALLARLSRNSTDEVQMTRPTSFPVHCIPALDHSTLLFRTLTAYLSVSALKPDGQKPFAPRSDSSMLPSIPNLFLYTKQGVHIGTAWVSAEDMYNEVLKNDERRAHHLTVEIAVLSGPCTGDWRTRNEKPTTWQYMQELAGARMHIGDLMSRYKTRMKYEKLIGDIYIQMVEDLGVGAAENSNIQVPPGFWELLAMRSNLKIAESDNFPGHTAAELQRVVDSLSCTGRGLSEEDSADFFQILLIGNLGDGENNGSGGVKDRIGTGEVRKDTLASIDGLAFRDVLLR